MPRQCGPPTAGEQVEAIAEPSRNLRHPEHTAASRRQLDCQRDSVEAPANSRHDGRNLPGR